MGIGTGVLVYYNMVEPQIIVKTIANKEPLCDEVEKEVIVYLPAPLVETKIIVPEKMTKKTEIVKKKEEPKVKSFIVKFTELLNENLFADAMTLYIEADEEILSQLQTILISYFQRISISTPHIAIEQMLEFQGIALESNRVMFVLVELYKKRKSYNEAITLLSEMIILSDMNDGKTMISNLITTTALYIKELTNAQSFHRIVSFLENRITLGIEPEFFTLLLAKHYIAQHEYFKAYESLYTIKFEEKHNAKTQELLAFVEKKIELNEAYVYKIPLERSGKHFVVHVYMNRTPLRLLLDTGASITSVRQDKLAHLNIVKENVVFNTAGGQVSNHIYKADTFSVGEIELEDFIISGTHYYDDSDDGLLGMNFLRKFDFKIDQQANILYLTKVE